MRVLSTGSAFSAAASRRFISAQHVVGRDHVGIELDLERGVGRADLGDALDLAVAHRVGHRQALEEGLERHLLVDLDEDVLVAAEGISGCHRRPTFRDRFSRALPCGWRSSQRLQPARMEFACPHVGVVGQSPDAARAWSSTPPICSSSSAARSRASACSRDPRPRRSACRAANRRRAGRYSPG